MYLVHDSVAFRSYYSTSRSLKKKQKKSQGSSRYRTGGDVELTALPLLKGGHSGSGHSLYEIRQRSDFGPVH